MAMKTMGPSSGTASSASAVSAAIAAAAAAAAASRPESIVVPACAALLAAVHQASADVTNFIRRCRPARTDLAPVTRELSELQLVLQLLGDCDAAASGLPNELQSHLRPILANCATIVQRIGAVLARVLEQTQHAPAATPQWTREMRDEVGELAGSLAVHRGVVGLVSDLVAVLIARDVEADTIDDQGHNRQHQQDQIAEVLEELRALGTSIRISYSNAALAREHFALQVHLGQIISYTETLAHTEVWEEAVRTLDQAQRFVATPGALADSITMRDSIPVTAPLRRGPSTATVGRNNNDKYRPSSRDIDNCPQNRLGATSPEQNRPNRPPSSFYSPDRTPKPDAGAPATGFIVMDGFSNSDRSNYVTTPTGWRADDQDTTRGDRNLASKGSPSSPKTRSGVVYGTPVMHRDGAESPIIRPLPNQRSINPRDLQASGAPLPFAEGLEVAIPPEKELVLSERNEGQVTEEALAFAHVPVHILGRLSVNLVDQLYPNKRAEESDKTSFNPSLSTVRTEEEAEEAYGDDVASAGTSATGSLRDGRHQFSQSDNAKSSLSLQRQNTSPQPGSTSQTALAYRSRPSTESALYTTHSHSNSVRTEDSAFTSPRPPPPPPRNPSRPSQDSQSFSSGSHLKPVTSGSAGHHSGGVRQMQSISTMNTETFRMQKPLPKAPIVYIPGYPGPFIKKKAVVVGNFSCGKTCLITRMSRGHFPRGKTDKCSITETIKLSVDEEPMELALWDIRGIDYDPTWLNDAHVALVCFSINIGSTDSKGKHLGRWVAEVNRNCPGAAILLVGLKSDIRFHPRSVEKLRRTGKALVTPEQGEQFRENIGASRYLECSARTGEGVLDVLGETARVAMHIRTQDNWKKTGRRPLSRIGRFFGLPSSSSGEQQQQQQQR